MTWPGIVTVIGSAAVSAMMGVLLSQILAGSRMFFAMGRRGDLPKRFSKVSSRNQVPVYGVFLSTLIILLTVWLGELTFITQTASFSILIYYGITNLAALKLKNKERFLPRWISWAGLILCISMAFSLPLKSILTGAIVLIFGHLLRLIVITFHKISKKYFTYNLLKSSDDIK